MGVEDKNFPPKNRAAQSLPLLEIKVECVEGLVTFDPNSLAMAVVDGTLFQRMLTPVGKSFLSDRPGYRFRDDDIAVVLHADEIKRLVCHELSSEQYFKLREHFGMFFLIHDDFYDPETGEAMQPMSGIQAILKDDPEPGSALR
jgi:hypothetical protein